MFELGTNADQFNTDYPCLMNNKDRTVLSSLIQKLPSNSILVEIGSKLGGSAKLIHDYMSQDSTLYCVDVDWSYPDQLIDLDDISIKHFNAVYDLNCFQTTFDFAKNYLKNCPNIRLMPADSPSELSWWKWPVDFVFEDSSHHNPQLHKNLNFWVKKLKPNGIIAGHDYTAEFPDVISEAVKLAKTLNTELHVDGTIWWMIKP